MEGVEENKCDKLRELYRLVEGLKCHGGIQSKIKDWENEQSNEHNDGKENK